LLLADYPTKKAFADAADLSPPHVSQMASGFRGMGDQIARQIETVLKLPAGWMDTDHRGMETAENAEFLDAIKNRLADREFPEHMRKTILAMMDTLPKKGEEDGGANDPNGPSDKKKGSGN